MAEDTEDKEELSMEDISSSIKDILMEGPTPNSTRLPRKKSLLLRPQRRSPLPRFPGRRLPKPSMTF